MENKRSFGTENRIKNLYIFLMVTVYPIAFWDFYFDIASAKFVVFVSMTLGAAAGLILYGCIRGRDCLNVMRRRIGESFLKTPFLRLMAAWCMINVISFAISKYKYTAFAGTSGRNYGLVTVVCITVMCIIVSSCDFKAGKIINVFIATSVLVAFLAVLNSFGIDFIGFYDGVRKDLRMMYQTTLGHVDICSTFFSLSFPISVSMAAFCDEKIKKMLYALASAAIYAGMFGGGCDSSFAVVIAATVIISIHITGCEQTAFLSILLILYVWIGKLMMCLNSIIPSSRNMDSIAVIITDFRIVCLLTAVLALFAAAAIITKKTLKCVIYPAFIVAAAAFAAAFVYFTFVDRNKDIGSLENILRFGDEWGSRRGYVWRVTIEKYLDNPWYNIIFGTGPDTLEPVLTPVYGDEMYRRFSAYYDNAHNEYLQYLMTTGIAGVTVYIMAIAAAIVNTVKKAADSEIVFSMLSGVLCYIIQAVAGINQVITTPLMFLLLVMCDCAKES